MRTDLAVLSMSITTSRRQRSHLQLDTTPNSSPTTNPRPDDAGICTDLSSSAASHESRAPRSDVLTEHSYRSARQLSGVQTARRYLCDAGCLWSQDCCTSSVGCSTGCKIKEPTSFMCELYALGLTQYFASTRVFVHHTQRKEHILSRALTTV